MPLRSVPRIQPTLPPQQPRLAGLDVSQPAPRETHFDNSHHPELFNNADLFPTTTASNAPQGSVQNVNPSPSQPFFVNGQSPWGCTWPWVVPPPPDHTCQHTSTNQNVQSTGPCPTCATNPTVGPVQFGGAQPAPILQDTTTQLAEVAALSSSTSSVPTAPHARPPASEASLFHPGAADAGGPTTSTENAHARKSRRVAPGLGRNPRPRREVPLVRVEEHIEWVRPGVMKMTLWFNWSPEAEAEAHEAWG
jgi:hypothetical protein